MTLQFESKEPERTLTGGVEVALRCAELVLKNTNTRMEDTAHYASQLAANKTPVSPDELGEVMERLADRQSHATLDVQRLSALADQLGLTAEA